MADVYCSYCYGLISDRDFRCKFCKRANARQRVDPLFGALLLSMIMGAFCTAIFARILYLSWPTWQKIFETRDNLRRTESFADEAAILAGTLVFVLSGLFTLMSIRRTKTKK